MSPHALLFAAAALATIALAPPAQAQTRGCAASRTLALPPACCRPIPSGVPDPFIPAVSMRRNKTEIALRSCLMTRGPTPAVTASFGLFGPDSIGRQSQLIAVAGGTPGGPVRAAPGVNVVPVTAADSTFRADLVGAVDPNVLVQIVVQAPGAPPATITRMVLATPTR